MFEKNNSELDRVILKLWTHSNVYEIENRQYDFFVSRLLCPRCGETNLPGEKVLAATSVLSPDDGDIYICNECALPDKTSRSVEDFRDWAIADERFTIK
ncbi:hypothetical protein [Enterococcus sp. LJL51]|uniref:hypothetical protein n=1 Tax=Enterococcus sp. LJL51 TaxID=3416656 RepID=UPI003CF26982